MKWFEKDLEIRYVDTDAMGVVHHSVYAAYMELCRINMLRQIELPYHKMEEAGIFLMVNDMQGRFRQALRFGDEVYIRGRLVKLTRRLLIFEYEIRGRLEDELRYTGVTKHLVTARAQAVTSMPEAFMVRLRTAVDEPES